MGWSSPRRPGNECMYWLKWILAYLFDCVHPHTTWPHRDRAGFAYICCLDCGRELPYSLERMRIVTRGELLADRHLEAASANGIAVPGTITCSSARSGACHQAF